MGPSLKHLKQRGVDEYSRRQQADHSIFYIFCHTWVIDVPPRTSHIFNASFLYILDAAFFLNASKIFSGVFISSSSLHIIFLLWILGCIAVPTTLSRALWNVSSLLRDRFFNSINRSTLSDFQMYHTFEPHSSRPLSSFIFRREDPFLLIHGMFKI